MPKVTNETKNKRPRNLLVAIIIVAALLLSDALFIGNTAYAVKWLQCGSQPVVLNVPPQISEGSCPPTYHVRISPNWFRSKQPLIINTSVSLHCSIDDVYKVLGDNDSVKIEVCDVDSVYGAFRAFGDSCD